MKPYYDDGQITLYCGDARTVLPHLMPRADLVLTDPPYSVSVAGAAHIGRAGNGVRRLDFFPGDTDWTGTTAMVLEILHLSIGCLAAHGSVYAWVGHRQFGAIVAQLEAAGFSTRFLVWAKACPAPPPPGAGWPSGAELCVYGYRAGRIWNHRGTDTPRTNVLRADSFRYGQPGKVDHPTQKPLAVLIPAIRASSRPQGCVLDPCCGSGSSLLAAKLLGRQAIGIEIEERYCAIAVQRLAQGVLPLEVG